MNSEKITEILNDLVQINIDRIAGYEVALADLDEGYDNLSELFTKMIAESKAFNQQFASEILHLDETVATGTSAAGKLYRTWMDVKALLTSGDIKTILTDCEAIESAIQRAYEEALDEEGLTAHLHSIISTQKAALLGSHHKIKHLLNIASEETL